MRATYRDTLILHVMAVMLPGVRLERVLDADGVSADGFVSGRHIHLAAGLENRYCRFSRNTRQNELEMMWTNKNEFIF
jgi:hypothetical protein